MKFKEYLENLNKIAKESPEVLEYEVIQASDDEGNSFQKVIYNPGQLGYFEGSYMGEFYQKDSEDWEPQFPVNAICIN